MKQIDAARHRVTKSKMGALRKIIADLLLALAGRLHPRPVVPSTPSLEALLAMPGFARLDPTSLENGEAKLTYRAVDPVWQNSPLHSSLIDLREHVVRLCLTVDELALKSTKSAWTAVMANLHLAASLGDLFAETDLQNDSWMCSPAADYEKANSEVAEKHLAGILIFNLVWTAYECAIEAAHGALGKAGKGARGRDWFLSRFGDKSFPMLRKCVLDAVAATHHRIDFARADMRRAIDAGAWAAIGAEHLRQFRNAVIHGDLPKPEPEAWGDGSEYRADEDPAIRQFAPNIRLTLVLIQIMALSEVGSGEKLSGWRSDTEPAIPLLEQLHHGRRPVELMQQMELDLPDAHRIADDEWWNDESERGCVPVRCAARP